MRTVPLICILSLIFSGCGYRLHSIPDQGDAKTISIPYVQGDVDGQLTASIIREVSESGFYVFREEGGEWILRARVIEDSYENIGFRYDRSKKEKLQNWLIPVEMREGILLELELVSNSNQLIVRGPNRLHAELEYDHDYYKIRDGVNVFSLGQLTDIDSAKEAAKPPLYQKLAEKVVFWLIYG